MKPHILLCLGLALATISPIYAEDAAPAAKPDPKALIEKLATTLTGSKMVGKYTIDGKDKQAAEEEYTIVSAMKLDEGDTWLINARIKYGDKDAVIPVPVEIKWAGDTPVITLTDVTIPGMGAGFSCRIVIYDNLYAGTWGHGKTVGHMFGRIVPAAKKE